MSFQILSIADEELVHDAARHGHVISLETYLHQNPSYLNKLYTYDKSTWTPLLAACFYRHEHVVRMLLRRFKADIEAVGDIFFDFPNNQSCLVKKVTPLWTAVAVNDFSIVKLLVEYGGANVKHLSKLGTTTFRAACGINNLDMARYLVEHGADPYKAAKNNYTNLMLAVQSQNMPLIRYLIEEIKCDISEQDENGKTALYYAVKIASAEIVKFLLEHGALNICQARRKITPLMQAALYGNISLVDAFEHHCTDLEWIEAKELLAANLTGCISKVTDRNKAIELLIEAFQLRELKNLPKLAVVEPLKLFDYPHECETLEQFNQFISSNSYNGLDIQATLIQQRLLGDKSTDYHHILFYNGHKEAQHNQYQNCLRWWFYAIDLQQKYNIPLKKEKLRAFVDIFAKMIQNNYQDILVDDLIRILKIMNNVLSKPDPDKDVSSNLRTLLGLITIAAKLLYDRNSTNNQEELRNDCRNLLRTIQRIVGYQYRTRKTGSTLLHGCVLSVSKSDAIWQTARLLIACGADVDALDNDKNTPLHILARRIPSARVFKLIELLCDSDAHLDYVDKDEKTPLQLTRLRRPLITKLLKKKMDVPRLKCLCARLIRQQQFSIQDNVSTSLLSFVQRH